MGKDVEKQNAGEVCMSCCEILLFFFLSTSKQTSYVMFLIITQAKVLPPEASLACLQVCLSARQKLRTLILLLILPIWDLGFQVRSYFW